MNVLIMDSEGLGSVNETMKHDMNVFCLSVMMSSVLVYNSVGSIDEIAVEGLECVVNMARRVCEGMEEAEFVWVVRDFALEIVGSEDEYLEMAVKKKNIKDFF